MGEQTPEYPGVRQIEEKDPLVDVEEVAHTPVEIILHIFMDIPQSVGAPVERVFRDLVGIKTEHFADRRVLAEVPDGLVLGVRVYGAYSGDSRTAIPVTPGHSFV